MIGDPLNLTATSRFRCTVYYEDTDATGLVYHANYLKFMERGRSDHFAKAGFHFEDFHKQGILFTVHSLDINYLRPAHLFDDLEVISHWHTRGRASFECEQQVVLAADNSHLFCKAHVKVACVDDTLQPCAIPKDILKELFYAG